jgi:hypothetical protein
LAAGCDERAGGTATRFGSARRLGEARLDPLLLFATERRIGQHNVDTVGVSDVGKRSREGVVTDDVRLLHLMQQQVHHPQQVGQRLLFDAA